MNLGKELYRVTGVFSPGEALYFSLNPICLGLFAATAVQVAAAEVVARRRLEGRWRISGAPVATFGVIAALAGGAAAIGWDSGGRDPFYGYIALYRRFFPGP